MLRLLSLYNTTAVVKTWASDLRTQQTRAYADAKLIVRKRKRCAFCYKIASRIKLGVLTRFNRVHFPSSFSVRVAFNASLNPERIALHRSIIK